MKLNRRFSQGWFLLLTAIISTLLFTTCDDDPLNLSAESILPPDDLLAVYDTTLSVELYTVPSSKLGGMNTQNTSTLGSRNDPRFGQMNADFLTDYIYSTTPSFFDTSRYDQLKVNSITLNLMYSSILGDTTGVDFAIYELNEAVPIYDSSDYVMSSHMYSPVDIVESKYFKAAVVDNNLTISSARSNNRGNLDTCVMKLSTEFAQKFVDLAVVGETVENVYISEKAFKNMFKGLYFAAKPRETKGGSLIQVNHYTSVILLETVEVHTADPSKNDTSITTFTLGKIEDGGWNLNIYGANFNAEVQNSLGDIENQYSKAYIQSLVGPQVLMRIPGLKSFRESLSDPISISYAELSLPYDTTLIGVSDESFPYPIKLGILDSLRQYPILDDQTDGFLGGIDTEANQYTLNMGNHIHEYIRNPDLNFSSSFYIYPGYGTPTIPYPHTLRGVVLNGTSSEVVNKPSIRIVYSIIPN